MSRSVTEIIDLENFNIIVVMVKKLNGKFGNTRDGLEVSGVIVQKRIGFVLQVNNCLY